MMSSNSDWRPWKILGLEGNNENEEELEKLLRNRSLIYKGFTYFLSHWHQDKPASSLFGCLGCWLGTYR
jgi:hypothetical protein